MTLVCVQKVVALYILLFREVLWLSDGGHLCLDWYNEGGGEQPTVLMLPGITGAQ